MDLLIGTTVDGRPAGFDTTSNRPLVLVGDAGRGKTTIARYLTRWWLADTRRHAHVYAHTLGEWADLSCQTQHLDELHAQPTDRTDRQIDELVDGQVDGQVDERTAPGCQPRTCLVVVDDVDLIDTDRGQAHTVSQLLRLCSRDRGTGGRKGRVIITSHGGIVDDTNEPGRGTRPPLEHELDCLGLLRPLRPNKAGRSDWPDPAEAAVIAGQGRLDWPINTVAVIPDPRGVIDFPCHRWHAPTDAWMAAVR